MPSETLLPIREVTRLTGINPVTLRAWERRYGLIVPQRTGKGHRLYSQEDVQRIQQILTWLDRGAAVSQVKALLQASPGSHRRRPAATGRPCASNSKEAIAALAERRLEQQVNQAMALYPAATLCEQLLMPLLADLELRWQGQFATGLEQVFFSRGYAASSGRGSITTTISSAAPLATGKRL
nr:MerR family transcriptional regulator [Pseudomonas sp. BIGb0427]